MRYPSPVLRTSRRDATRSPADAEARLGDDLFERFAAKVATLTPAECSALVAAHRHPDGEAAGRWFADQRMVLELGFSGLDGLERA